MMSRRFLVCLLLAGSAIDLGADEVEQIKSLVANAQRAGFERHDFAAYMKQWADNAKLVLGRSEQHGKYDTTLNLEQIAATKRIRFRGEPDASLRFENVEVKIVGDRATLHWHAVTRYPGASSIVAERYLLARRGESWQVIENRAWPLAERYGPEFLKFDAAKWQELDAAVAAVRAEESDSELIPALFAAYRYNEGYAAALALTGKEPKNAEAWLWRGHAALIVGQPQDAERAFQQAHRIDASAPIPGFMRARK